MINLDSIELDNDIKNKTKKLKKKTEDELSFHDIMSDDINFGYPKLTDPNLQTKIYEKRELYYYKMPNRPDLTSYKDIEEYRKKICDPKGGLLEHQAMISNFINPDTPYKGLLIFHGTGTGKTCVGVAVGEKFKQQVQRYKTHIYVLVPGQLLKENWRNSLIECTEDTYIKTYENLLYLNEEEKEKIKKQAITNALQFYKIMSYATFYRKVLGEKILEKKVIDGKMKISYKKNEDGDFERDISFDVLENLNNSLIIVDEAHNLTDNVWGESLIKIIKNSINLKVLLLTATPMKNLGSDIVHLLNYLRPQNSQIEKDKIFNSSKNHTMELKEGGLEYLQKMAHGYISYLRGADPMTFAKRIDIGIKPKGLIFTKITQCQMEKFQLEAYEKTKLIAIEEADGLDRKSGAVSNFVFPGLDESKKKLIGLFGRDGLNQLKNQLKNHYNKINDLIASDILGLKKSDEELISINDNTKNITGAILKKKYLRFFSTKFYQALVDLEKNLFIGGPDNNKESRTGFIYSNLVNTGIEIFQEILNVNGFLEYNENRNNYQIKDNTICYYCGKKNSEHFNKSNNSNVEKTENDHIFFPATYLVITGDSTEEGAENAPDQNKKIIKTVFSNFSNKDGKNIKLVLGSKVMNEGITMFNVATVQILDVYWNFGRLDQVVGRAIRWCSHYNLMSENNVYPEVKVYKYAVTLNSKNNELSKEEDLYYKAELKYLLIKKIERALKTIAIDCPLNQQGNMFKEEIEYFNKCIVPNNKMIENVITDNDKKELIVCPSKCDFTDCLYKCNDSLLNSKYYDPTRHLYKNLSKKQLDKSTFTANLAKSEIDFSKKKIKELYMVGYVYNLKTIVDYVKESYNSDKKELFDDFFVQKALDELIPVTENDFNNFKDIIYDKTYRSGYLIYLDGYYIYQPFDELENVPMYYRTTYRFNYESKLSLHNYLINNNYISSNINSDSESKFNIQSEYNFEDVMDYYDNRNEYKIVGIIDKETNKSQFKNKNDIKDVFKIREKRNKVLEKKRGTGIPSIKGAVCATSKQKEYLETLLKELGIKIQKTDMTRDDICNDIMNKLIELEKYSTGKNKITYIMIPNNHPTLKFPLNLEDRVEYLQNYINKILAKNINFDIKNDNKTKSIKLSFKITEKLNNDNKNKFIKIGLTTSDNLKWSIIID